MSTGAAIAHDLTGRKLGRYEVLTQLASGGMATVYVARAQGVAGFERLVAVKVLHPHLAHDDEFISMFLDEARLAARIRHPNVVPTLDISDSKGDGYFLVMEYIEGDHFGALLREAAKAKKTLPVAVTLRIVSNALDGLGAAHTLLGANGERLEIVHRDISPHNILVGSDGIARITDFGVAKAEIRLSSTRDGQFKGKLAYMAPEQASSGFADQRSDLFSMGVVLWEALVGRRLFKAENNGELLNRLFYAAIPPPSEYVADAAPIDAVLAKALERDPDKRFQTTAEFLDAIEAAASSIGGLASERAVSRTVKELLGAKIETESARIRSAIDLLGRSQVSSPGAVPRPEPSGLVSLDGADARSAPSQPSQVRRANPEDMTVGARPVALTHADAEPPPPSSRSKLGLAVGLIVGLLLVVAGLAWALVGREEASEASAAAPPQDTAVPVAPRPTEPPPPPLPAEAAPSASGEGTEASARGADDRPSRPDERSSDGAPARAETPPTEEVEATRPRVGADRRGGRRQPTNDGVAPTTTSSPSTRTTTAPARPSEDDLIPSPYR